MADILTDGFGGGAGSITGRAVGSYVWMSLGTGLSLTGSGAAGGSGTGDASRTSGIENIDEVFDADIFELTVTLAVTPTTGQTFNIQVGESNPGDLYPGNFYCSITNAAYTLRTYTVDAAEDGTLPGGAIVAGDALRFRFDATQTWGVEFYVNDVLVSTYGSEGFYWAGVSEPSLYLITRDIGLFDTITLVSEVTPEPPTGESNVLIKNTELEVLTEMVMVPGTPYQPARPAYYSYETGQVCGWVYQGPGHYEYWTDPRTGQTQRVWIPDGPGGNVAYWVCSPQTRAVYHPATPAVPATPPSYYPNTTYRTGFNLGWNSGARSEDVIFGDGTAQWQVGVSNVGVIVGLNIDDGAPVTYNGNTINYGFYAARGSAWVIKNGVIGASVGTYDNTTLFKVERTGGAISFKVNGSEVSAVASGAPETPFWLEAAMYSGQDIVFNPILAQIGTGEPDDITGTIAGSFPPMVGLLTEGEHCEIAGALPYLTSEITAGLLAPSFAVINGPLSIFSGEVFSPTGEVATIDGDLSEMSGIMADHPYGVIAGSFEAVTGVLFALEGNAKASFSGAGYGTGEMTALTVLVVSLVGSAQFSSTYTVNVSLSAEMRSTATLSFLLSLTSIQRAIMMSVAAASELAKVPEDDVETWVINMDSALFGSTQYTNFDFNSYATIDGRVYAAGRNGMYLLEGEDDDGTPIKSVVSLGKQAGGSAYKKTWSQCYLGMSAQGNLFVKVIAEGQAYIYKTRDWDPELQQQRVTFGKGLRTNYVTLEIYNETGADFELDTVEFKVADLTRKI